MGPFLLLVILILVAAGIATIIRFIVLALNGDDGQPWPHDTTGNEHHWE